MAGAVAGGGALLSASLQVLLDRMASRDVLTFLRGQKLSATLLRNLQLKLLEVQAVLNDAEAKQITNSAVKDWVDELKDAVYDAEDLVDHITTEALRRKMDYDSQTQVRNIIFGEGIESRVEEITDTLEYLSLKKDVLGLKKGVGENLSKRWPTTSLVDESGVYGRDVNREEIVKFLLSHNASGNGIGVIALVGMGGIGKTTLTQLVYNDRRVDRYFDLRAWICVSDEFDLVRITKTIVKAIDSGTSENSSDENDLNLLQLKLKERLSRKKFCLVLDDVWNENYNNWDRLQTPFTVGLPGSKIIVTTRSNNVATVMHSDRIHHLGQLSFEDCWSLFAKQAFKNGNSSRHPKLEEIGKEIVKKCKGLPLAAKTLGGALYSESRVEEWENVLNSETWDLPNDEILPALRSEYDLFERFETLTNVNGLRTFLPLNLGYLPRYHLMDKVSENRGPVRLRHLDIRHSNVKGMPSQMGQLKSLQKLTNYRVGKKSGTRVGELRELSHICGILSIEELQNAVDGGDASEANLVGKRYLDDLRLEWNDDDGVDQNGADLVLNNLLPHSNLKRLTIQGYGGLRFPDWLGGPAMLMINMVSLRLWRCKNVSAFPPLGQLPSLKHLYISGAEEVERVGAEFYGTDSSSTKPSFVSLKALSFSFMPKWKEWLCLGSQGGEFPRLKELYIQDCPKLTGDLPDHLPLLTKLNIEECEQLVAPLPRVPAIRELTTSNSSGVFFRSPASDFMRLESLITSDISKWTELPPVLQQLSIENADCLESLLEEEILQSNTCLQDLTITKCSFSRTLRRVCLPITLKSLRIYESKNLELLLPEFFKCHFSLLETLDILNGTCNSLCFPLSLFPSAQLLTIFHLQLQESQVAVAQRCMLSVINIEWCPELIFPVQGLPSNLTSLSITNYEKFRSQMELGLQGLTSLRRFSISSKCEDLELFPKECLLPSTLTSLEVSDLPNLRSLDSKGLQLLTTLQKLKISYCPKLQSLTEEGLPTSLSFLTIENCPLVKDRCKFGTGEEWHHIAHIPHILIDDQLFSKSRDCVWKSHFWLIWASTLSERLEVALQVHISQAFSLEFLNIAGGFWQLSNHFNSLQELFSSQEEDLPLPAHAIDGSLVAKFTMMNVIWVILRDQLVILVEALLFSCAIDVLAMARELASSGNDNQQPVLKLTEHTAAVKDIALSPHQSGLLAFGGGTADQYICFWSTTSGNQLNHVDIGSQSALMAIPKSDYGLETPINDNEKWRRDRINLQLGTLRGVFFEFTKSLCHHCCRNFSFNYDDQSCRNFSYCSLLLNQIKVKRLSHDDSGLDDNFHLAVKKVDGRGQDAEREFEMLVLDSAESLIFQVKSPAETLLIMPWRHMNSSIEKPSGDTHKTTL
ncbi:putative disease resistance RPP13-like protein 1 [Vitis vinifera]|uniref:Putative disease resistance RPP13-like protein 1 n=1 Tax=Vitis vinifera TaxID=29760 RepID=A0A438D531_VITVI|nr:putative disease resistance RPP13-like protein 1 [Vitis vinifera]